MRKLGCRNRRGLHCGIVVTTRAQLTLEGDPLHAEAKLSRNAMLFCNTDNVRREGSLLVAQCPVVTPILSRAELPTGPPPLPREGQ